MVEMKRGFIAVLLFAAFVIFSMQISSALEVKITDVSITTVPLRDVKVTFYGEGTEDVIQTFNEKSYLEGKVNFKFYSLVSSFDYEVKVFFGNNEVASEKFEGHSAMTPISVTIGLDESGEVSETEAGESADAGTEEVSEGGSTGEPAELDEESTTTEDTQNQNAVSGAAIVGESPSVKDYWYFIAAGILGLGLLGFLVTRKIYASHGNAKGNFVPPRTIQRSVDPSKSMVPQKSPDSSSTRPAAAPKTGDELERRISEAEARIREAQSDLRKIREDEKIKFAERRLQRDMDELNKLKKQQDKVDFGPK